MENTLWIIAPDKSSGDAFTDQLRRQRINNLQIDYPYISPRVIGDKINNDPQVGKDLEVALKKAQSLEVAIACNTLQLWLPKVKIPTGMKVYTTFEAARRKYYERRPVWLGTSALVTEIRDFPTLVSMGYPEIQNQVQEIIWRVKATTGSEYKTASTSIVGITDKVFLKNRVENMLTELGKVGISEAILGCTELPMVIDRKSMVDAATLLAEWISQERPNNYSR